MKSKCGATATNVKRAWMGRVFVALLLWCVPQFSWAHPEVDAARAAYMEGDFVGVLSHLDAAERSPSATEADRVSIHWYRAASYHALGRAQDAAVAMDALLMLRPMFVPSRGEAPPDLRAALADRQRVYQELHGVTLGDPELVETGVRVALLGHIESVGRVVAFVRVAPDTDYTPVTLQITNDIADGELPLTVWQRAAKSGTLDLVLEAHNPRGALAARAGDALKPLSLVVTPEAAKHALAQLHTTMLIENPPPAAPVPQVATENPVQRHVPKATTAGASRYRFGFPPWVFVMLTTGIMATCGGFSFGGCSLLGMLTIVVAAATADSGDFGGLFALPLLMTLLSCGIGTFFCCSAVPFSGCTGVLWVADFFYVNPQERAVRQPAPTATEEDDL